MPVISCMPEKAPAHLATAPAACSYCSSLDQHPKLSQYWPFWTAWGWFLDPVPLGNFLSFFLCPWEGSARWSAPNVPVPGSLLPSPCAPGGGWLQCHLAMAQPGEPGLLEVPPHGSVWLQGQGWGWRGGRCQGHWGQRWGCSGTLVKDVLQLATTTVV